MNQEKIGAFICEMRKAKKLTQAELAEKLGVSDRTVGNWENGRNLPDLSLFKPLCDILEISINDLISGEKVEKTKYLSKFEENMINTIDYSSKKLSLNRKTIAIILLIMGFFLMLSSSNMFAPESSWGSIFMTLASFIILIGINRLFKHMKLGYRILVNIGLIIIIASALLLIDYLGVVGNRQMSRFCIIKTGDRYVYQCENPFYNTFLINGGTKSEYLIIDYKKEYTVDTVPYVPFNRDRTGIDNISKYNNKYLGNNSNTGNLISNLPLSEYGYTFQIDPDNLSLTVNYHITDWYINEDHYLEKCLVYNTVSIFTLIDNVKEITFNFSGNEYTFKRSNVINNYPNYDKINTSKDNFNKYLEQRINDEEFIEQVFDKMINQ